nr:hypothetical protein [Tanacetum cinerariifolium]
MEQNKDDLTGDDLKLYKTDTDIINLILLSIPSDIYNSVDACKNAKDMWERQYEAIVNASRAKRAAKTHDPLALVANTYASSPSFRFSHAYYVTHPPSVIGYDDDYQGEAICDDQEDSLTTVMMLLAHQYEAIVNASRAKRAAKTHDPLALVANTYASSPSFRFSHAYYVTHPPSVIGYDDDYQGEAICDDQEDSLTTVMMLLAHDTRNATNVQRILRTTTNSRNGPNVQ